MALRTVAVPESMQAVFAQAESVVSAYFSQRSDDPQRGTIEIRDERYILVRAGALSVEFFGVVRDLLGADRQAEADAFSRNLLFDLAHAVGRSDARKFAEKMQLDAPIERLSAGPIHFAHTGWAFVDISQVSMPDDPYSYHLVYDHPYSFESDAWLQSEEQADFPVCVMNAGYSAGWCEDSFGVPLVATEVLCRARGDDCCRFIMAHPEQIERRLQAYATRAGISAEKLKKARIPDLFARKRLEEELRRARDELEQRVAERTEELRVANARLEEEIAERAAVEEMLLQAQKVEVLGLLAGGVAHDFNNLLTAIGGYGELVVNHLPTDSPVANAAMKIVQAADRASDLTKQLLVFSRRQVATLHPIDVRKVVEQLRGLLRPLIGEDIALHIAMTDRPTVVAADPGQLESVLMNLVLNARDAMPGGGDITIDVHHGLSDDDKEVVVITVADDGIGMDPQTAARIFDPFFTTKGVGAGTGLGLATARTIVQQSDGEIEVESQPGVGTTVTVLLPSLPADALPAADPSPPPFVAVTPRSVLVVEDDLPVRDLMVGVLGRLGHRVHSADNAADALTIFESEPGLELVISDVIMPDISGPQMVAEMRKERPGLPVIFVSGYTDDRLAEFDLSGHNTELLHKPFRLGRLEQVMTQVLG